jgi:glycerophosphoryl diester phosphodiesterase
VLVLSHRGYAVDVAENTLAAFEAAARMGVDGVETDVRLAADGAAVLFHDRFAADGREVAALSRAELSRAAGRDVPTLEEALAAWPDLLWMVEVKAPESAPEVERTLRRLRPGRALVTSFHHEVARALSDRLGIEGGVIVAHAPLAGPDVPFGLPARAGRLASIVWRYDATDLAAVERASRAGYRSWVYDVRSPADHDRALALPLAGLVSDRPELALER